MSETAQHRVAAQDSSLEAIDTLAALDLSELSFVQLKRLEKVLRQAGEAVAGESAKRADVDNSGDTVKVPSPKL